MKLRTRILSYLAIIVLIGGLFTLGAPSPGPYSTMEGWSGYVLAAVVAIAACILCFEVLCRMWRR